MIFGLKKFLNFDSIMKGININVERWNFFIIFSGSFCNYQGAKSDLFKKKNRSTPIYSIGNVKIQIPILLS